MAEYIEREAAIESFRKSLDGGYVLTNDAQTTHILQSLPAADVRPVVRGHIEEDENTYLYCSECNCNITLVAYETPNGNLILRPNFCPNCGAMMEES